MCNCSFRKDRTAQKVQSSALIVFFSFIFYTPDPPNVIDVVVVIVVFVFIHVFIHVFIVFIFQGKKTTDLLVCECL